MSIPSPSDHDAPDDESFANKEPVAEVATDQKRFATLFDETYGPVYRYARTLTHDADLAEDVASDTYLRAWNKRDSFRGDGSPLSWLLAITRNCAFSALRRSSIESLNLDGCAVPAASAPDPETEALAAAKRRVLLAAIAKLNPEQREVIELRFIQQRSFAEIAVRLGRSGDALRQQQRRALLRLRGLLEEMSVS